MTPRPRAETRNYRGAGKLRDCVAIINTTSITAFTRSLSQALADQGIWVNAVAPGPIWTPLIPSTFSADQVEKFSSSQPLGRVEPPDEVAPAFIFLASDDAAYMSGQVLHPNGGEVVNG